jgi:two-component system, chemotaxis family, chemotaxis protein CheY
MPAAAAVKIMVVDDQPSMRALARQALNALGFRQVRDCGSAADALTALREAPAHVILSDYNMPEMDGLQFLAAIRGDPQLQKLIFIMLTGAADQGIVQQALALKANNFIAKPFTPATLKERIEQVIGAVT